MIGLGVALVIAATAALGARGSFDHEYQAYGRVLAAHVQGARVDYRALAANRASLDKVVSGFGVPDARTIASWSRPQQLVYWINAYNAFTLKAVIDHYPIKRRRFSLHPDRSIRQIPGVWNRLTWQAAGQAMTLDHIEHQIIRPRFDEPRIHFAIICASVSCPPIADVPYRAATLDAQLDRAARAYLASPQGLEVHGYGLRVSMLFRWYGDEFVAAYSGTAAGRGSDRDRAIAGVVKAYGPRDAARAAATGRARITFLPYDWALDDVADTP